MSDHEFENYLTLISRFLRLSPTQRDAIGEELRDHFESRLTELLDSGLSHDEAVKIALAEFGDAAGLAASFTSVSQTRRRRLIMRCTVASVAGLAAAVVVAMAIWPANHAGRVVANAVAETAEKPQAKTSESPKSIEVLTYETERTLNGLTDLEFVETPLAEALTFIGDKHHLQFYIHKRSLENAALDAKQIPVSLNLHNVRLKTCLEWMLAESDLGYIIRDGVLLIATQDWIDAQVETRVYDCREFLHNRPDASYADAAVSLVELINQTIARGTWVTNGGNGTAVICDGLLVVNQTPKVQTQVADLLDEIVARLKVKK